MQATEESKDWSGLCEELQRFIMEAQCTGYELSQPLDMYVEELSGILRKHISIRADNRG